MAAYVGVDPGVGGAIAILLDDGTVAHAAGMPETDRDVLDVLAIAGDGARGVLERVSASPQMGVSSSFTFGKSYGALRMALVAAGVAFDEVLPAAWQKALGCRTRGDKSITKRLAQQMFPAVKVTNANAEALLIAEYCRRLHRGAPQEELVLTPPPPGPPKWRFRATAKGDLF